MNKIITRNILAVSMVMLVTLSQVSAQSKDETKAREALAKAMTQTDAAKRQEGINKAKEGFIKAGMKPQEVSAIVGEAYLEKGDLVNAQNAFNASTKELKKEGLKKVAEAYVDQAFNEDEKAAAKSLNKAMSLFGKSDATKEGARMIGDRYYEKGMGSYDKAIEYYVIGEGNVKIEQIAKEYFDKGGENEVKAAETYLKLKTTAGAKKAGDIYYNRSEFQKAIEAYLSGGVEEGITKYANYLYSENRAEEADNLYVQLAENYAEQKNDDAIEKLAASVSNKGSYALASKLYEKAGNVSLSDKNRAYDALVGFRLEEAQELLTNNGETALATALNTNQKALTPLRDLEENMAALLGNAPPVNLITDEVTGKSVPSADDQKIREEYYKSIRDQIIKNVFDISAGYAKLTDPNLKKYVRQSFLKYGAVRNILDSETLAIKKQKADIKIKDIVL